MHLFSFNRLRVPRAYPGDYGREVGTHPRWGASPLQYIVISDFETVYANVQLQLVEQLSVINPTQVLLLYSNIYTFLYLLCAKNKNVPTGLYIKD